jgi:hypothetical protein
MLSTAIFAACLTTAGLLFLAMKGGMSFVKKLLGYDWIVDIVVTIGVTWLFGMSGTVSGLMAGIVTGLILSIILLAAKHTLGYSKLVPCGKIGRRQWQNFDGAWTHALKDKLGEFR